METAILQPKVQRAINAKIPKDLPKPKIMLAFDPGDEKAARLIREQTHRFLADLSRANRETIFGAISEGLQEGANPRKISLLIQQNIGLTDFQNNAVKNYRSLLENGSREALDRGLRPTRNDNMVERSISGEKPLTSKQIDLMVGRYRQKYIRYRADTIARTEAGGAIAVGQDEALRQTAENVGFTDDQVIRTWNTTRDSRARDTHAAMNQQPRELGKPFDSPSGAKLRFPRDPLASASERINCRCNLTTSFK